MAVCASLLQSVAFSGSRPERRRREGRLREGRMRKGRLRTLHDPILAFLESLEFLEILRLLKFDNFITMVRRNLGSATPPSVMALFMERPVGVHVHVGVQI